MSLPKKVRDYFNLRKDLIESNNFIYSLIKPKNTPKLALKGYHRPGEYISVEEKDKKTMEIIREW